MDALQAMRVFVRVVEAGSFTRAADSLGLPKGTVTKLIQALEARLRTRLLNRTTRRVTVTPDGAAYYERSARLINEFDEMEASITNAQASPRGRLRVDVGSSIARLLIIPALDDFYARYPDIQLELGVSDQMVDLVADNVDCVIRGGELTDQSLVARRIGNLPFVTVAAPAYLERHGTPATPADIETDGHRLIQYFSSRTRHLYPIEFRRDGQVEDISGNARTLAVNESNALHAALRAGLGIAQCAAFLVDGQLKSGELVRILPEWHCEPLPMHVVYPPNRHLSAKVRVFVDWAVELFAAHPQLQLPAQR